MLAILLVAAGGGIAYVLLELERAKTTIIDKDQQLEQQQELIDQKVTFNAAMRELMTTASEFDGVLLGSLVSTDIFEDYARQAWLHREKPNSLDRDLRDVRETIEALKVQLTDAASEAATNSSGTVYETVSDQFGAGFVTTVIDDADSICQSDVLACVLSDDPYTVHVDAADSAKPYMTDEIRTGIAYHEFAHVLQLTNGELTDTALAAFGGDGETMADCFALTYLPGWKLDHRVWVNSYSYWDVSIGYGYTCDETQMQTIRDWYDGLDFHLAPISQ